MAIAQRPMPFDSADPARARLSEPARPHFSILFALGERTRALLWAIQAENQKRSCQVASTVDDCVSMFERYTFDMVMVGTKFPDGSGRQVAELAYGLDPRPRLVAVLPTDLPHHRAAFDEAQINEFITLGAQHKELDLLWRIWLGQA